MPPSVRAFAPGRVNLIGEHTDYNDGLCLPFAIDRGITVDCEPLDGRVEVSAEALGERDAFALAGVEAARGWRAYVRGVAALLARGGRLTIRSDLPPGAGLSSSAALSVAVALALLGREPDDRRMLARLCSRVERDWAGANTGLLDQLAILLAAPGRATRLDLRTLEATPVPVDLGGWTLVAADSGAPRHLAAGGYNARRAECEAACRQLAVGSLRDVGLEQAAALPAPLDRRVRHVVTENERVDAAAAALRQGDLGELARLLDASHASLRDDYEVSVGAVERTVRSLKAAGAAGARIMGGGFGGSVLALFPPGVAPPAGTLTVRPSAPARLVADRSAGP